VFGYIVETKFRSIPIEQVMLSFDELCFPPRQFPWIPKRLVRCRTSLSLLGLRIS
jgi:hypothetical protein